MSEVKRCIQCNELKPVDGFREYTHSRVRNDKTRVARYRICKDCENINTRYYRAKAAEQSYRGADRYTEKYVNAQLEVDKIETLYRALEDRGCRTPLSKNQEKPTVIDEVDRLLEKLDMEAKMLPVTGKKIVAPEELTAVPDELKYWLGDEWKEENQSPEFFQETIYESLKAKYRPQIGIDKEQGIIIYDDTYKRVLNDILRNFDDYEDGYVETDD